jgi:ubiquinone/menaquinone biosynthesis C-methylase UbiE
MIATEHRVSELVTMYKKLANVLNPETKSKALEISNYVTGQNLIKSLSSLNISTILDVGGGSGDRSAFLAKNGFEVTLLDSDTELLQAAAEKFHKQDLIINMLVGDIENMPFQNEAFDLVIAEGGIISLTDDPIKMIKEFRRITKPGGYIWIDYLNLIGWSVLQPDVETRMMLANKDEEVIYMGKDKFPLKFFSPKKLRYLLYDCGFLELNEFGNGILTNPMMEDQKINGAENEMKKTELELSRNYNLIGAAFHIQVLAQKIIY